MKENTDYFDRTRLLVGDQAFEHIYSARVIIFGIGGVGSWCAESLVRSGIRRLTMVDIDNVRPSNINRQLVALTSTVGEPKVEVLRKRLLDINPEAEITAIQRLYSAETSESFLLETYDYVIDAIYSLEHKAHLILKATSLPGVTLLSSMGAALKVDPFKISSAEFWKVQGCPLARALRQRFKRDKAFPRRKFRCVYSPEVVPNKGALTTHDENLNTPTPRVNGTLAHTTAIFGFSLAGLLIEDLLAKATSSK